MRFSLLGLIRLVVLLAGVAGTAAVGVARLEPVAARARVAATPRYSVLNGFVLTPRPVAPQFLDSGTGRVQEFDLPEGDQFDYGACSPWVDERGDFQVAGRWMERTPRGEGSLLAQFKSFGLARYALPSGRVLDRVPMEVLPASAPCWYPGAAGRVLYAGGDGFLYTYNFDDGAARDGSASPQRLAWRCEPPGEVMLISDPVWLHHPRLGGRLVVAMQYRVSRSDPKLTPSRLWWLSLSADGRSVAAAAPLTDPDEGASRPGTVEERSPALAVTPGGGLALAYLWQPRCQTRWQLRVAPVGFDGRSGTPVVVSGSARTLDSHHASTAASFSADGRWVFGIINADDGRSSIVRFPVEAGDGAAGDPGPSPAGATTRSAATALSVSVSDAPGTRRE